MHANVLSVRTHCGLGADTKPIRLRHLMSFLSIRSEDAGPLNASGDLWLAAMGAEATVLFILDLFERSPAKVLSQRIEQIGGTQWPASICHERYVVFLWRHGLYLCMFHAVLELLALHVGNYREHPVFARRLAAHGLDET